MLFLFVICFCLATRDVALTEQSSHNKAQQKTKPCLRLSGSHKGHWTPAALGPAEFLDRLLTWEALVADKPPGHRPESRSPPVPVIFFKPHHPGNPFAPKPQKPGNPSSYQTGNPFVYYKPMQPYYPPLVFPPLQPTTVPAAASMPTVPAVPSAASEPPPVPVSSVPGVPPPVPVPGVPPQVPVPGVPSPVPVPGVPLPVPVPGVPSPVPIPGVSPPAPVPEVPVPDVPPPVPYPEFPVFRCWFRSRLFSRRFQSLMFRFRLRPALVLPIPSWSVRVCSMCTLSPHLSVYCIYCVFCFLDSFIPCTCPRISLPSHVIHLFSLLYIVPLFPLSVAGLLSFPVLSFVCYPACFDPACPFWTLLLYVICFCLIKERLLLFKFRSLRMSFCTSLPVT
ncbi:hypothetical protein EYF80_059188 [Liparis tanakae]|uniref:Uncharacterized protein n=1 Tax=Liparis tanakae TaxID=230148 RepID=A0A4Z2EPX3_9TELE|nr:hypothetical protein EYF80_059188 [Liparis tanakae]